MSIWAAPGAPFIACSAGAPSGLTGVMTVRVVNDFETAIPAQTDGISEQPPGSRVYFVVGLVAPLEEGQWQVAWNDGVEERYEDLFVDVAAATLDQNPRVQPGGLLTIESRNELEPGLVGVIAVRLRDIVAQVDVVARTTAGIVETAPGRYSASLVAPYTPKILAAIWDAP